jgi:hypothetical protein
VTRRPAPAHSRRRCGFGSREPILVLGLLAAGCGGDQPSPPAVSPAAWFVDRASETGLDFLHTNGMTGKLYMAEILSPGVALFDYDNDGDLDVYLVQGQILEAGPESRTRPTAAGPQGRTRPTLSGDRLYRNDLTAGVLRFTDVTAQSGIVARGYGMGVATGDFDNDGWVDLELAKCVAPNQLLRNNGDGTFTDV